MYLSILVGFLSINMVFAGVLMQVGTKLKAMNDGELMTENVNLNYVDNYIQINTPPLEGKTSATIIHHVPMGVTQYRQAGHCFMLASGYVFSTDKDDWFERVGDRVPVMKTENFVLFNYTAAPFCLDREKIPLVMQDDCEEIYPAVLVNTEQGEFAYRRMREINSPFLTLAFGPSAQPQNENIGGGRRNKRDFGNILGDFVEGFMQGIKISTEFLQAAAPVAQAVAGIAALAGK